MEPTKEQESGAPQGDLGTRGKRSFWQRRPVIVIGTVVLFGLLFYGLRYLAESLTHEWTDDAFLDADVVSVAPKVGGQVKQVHVRNNQAVKAGITMALPLSPASFGYRIAEFREDGHSRSPAGGCDCQRWPVRWCDHGGCADFDADAQTGPTRAGHDG